MKNSRILDPYLTLNLWFKAIEKSVASQVNTHVNQENLNEIFQSAYKPYHSTETALTIELIMMSCVH